MPHPSPSLIRRLFRAARADITLMTAADLLGVTLAELQGDIDDGVIVATWAGVVPRISGEELVAAAMRRWDQAAIEDALSDDAGKILPKAIRLVMLRVRVPRYQRDVLVALADQEETSVDAIVARELEDVASAHAEQLASVLPSLAASFSWPRTDRELRPASRE